MASQTVSIGKVPFGGNEFVVIGGPCSVESYEQFDSTAAAVKKSGASLLRGGIFKMRTDPKSFQGLGGNAFEVVRTVKEKHSLSFVTEITDPRQISDLVDVVDAFQVGSRNMHNFYLLKELGQTKKPILLKRGFAALIKEWLLAADYIVSAGNDQIILCERGIRTFETETRNTLDLNAVAYAKAHTSYPVIVDPSHGTGRKELVAPLAWAAAALGADGIMVEVHPEPQKALSDGFQALRFEDFELMMVRLEAILNAVQRPLHRVP